MKKVENKVTEISVENNGEKLFLDYFTMCRNAINVMPQGGFSVEEMSKRLRITDALKKAEDDEKEEAEIEDADFKTLSECVKTMRWRLMHEDIVEFTKYIESL